MVIQPIPQVSQRSRYLRQPTGSRSNRRRWIFDSDQHGQWSSNHPSSATRRRKIACWLAVFLLHLNMRIIKAKKLKQLLVHMSYPFYPLVLPCFTTSLTYFNHICLTNLLHISLLKPKINRSPRLDSVKDLIRTGSVLIGLWKVRTAVHLKACWKVIFGDM